MPRTEILRPLPEGSFQKFVVEELVMGQVVTMKLKKKIRFLETLRSTQYVALLENEISRA